jgi:hypothetical protein
VSNICGAFYIDSDSDSYGDANSPPIHRCGSTPPSGYVTNNGDCCDNDQYSYPNSTNYQARTNGCGSWDWDCNGVQKVVNGPAVGTCGTLQCNNQSLGSCDPVPNSCTCSGTDQCATYTTPACGEEVYIVSQICTINSDGGCGPVQATEVDSGFIQLCH